MVATLLSSWSTCWDAHHAGDLDRQQLWQRNQEWPGSASKQQQQQQPADNVRFEDLDIYIVSPAATSPPSCLAWGWKGIALCSVLYLRDLMQWCDSGVDLSHGTTIDPIT